MSRFSTIGGIPVYLMDKVQTPKGKIAIQSIIGGQTAIVGIEELEKITHKFPKIVGIKP